MAELTSRNGRSVQQIIAARFCISDSDVTPGTSIDLDLGADSLDNIDLCMTLEKEFGIALADDEWNQVTTVAEIEELVTRRVNETN